MPGIKTEITELATGLGALGHDLRAALESPPGQFVNVAATTWDNLRDAYDAGAHRDLFADSWQNGRAFLLARDGLRGRIPVRVEWKGPDRQVGKDPIPADLRIDHVFLVSIKTRSDVLWNRAPDTVFLGRSLRKNWYIEVAALELQALYHATRLLVGGGAGLPESVEALTSSQGRQLAAHLPDRVWPPELHEHYRRLARRTATESAHLWQATLAAAPERELAAWWLLRLAPAPYYLLGASSSRPLRIRVDTPWDWRQQWEFVDLDIAPALDAGQPQVDWTLLSRHRATGELRSTEGYVEVRWSHRKFVGYPEAKVQLRSRHEDVPGYTPLE